LAAKTEIIKVVREGLLVAFIGALLAFLANAVSPKGLTLSRDYFPGVSRYAAVLPANPVPGTAATNTPSPFELLAAHFREKGLQLADSNQVIRLFHDPRVEQNLIVFIDARKDEEYQQGHIPGAWQFDYVHHENYLPTIGPLCQGAEQVVVYCGGGQCELSEYAAIDLRDILTLSKEKLLVYGGGFNEWTTNQMPVEIGERKSGKMRNVK
jgi:rhodanese-related sulfurtransferase